MKTQGHCVLLCVVSEQWEVKGPRCCGKGGGKKEWPTTGGKGSLEDRDPCLGCGLELVEGL